MDDRGIVIFMVDEKMSPAVGKQLLKVNMAAAVLLLYSGSGYFSECFHSSSINLFRAVCTLLQSHSPINETYFPAVLPRVYVIERLNGK